MKKIVVLVAMLMIIAAPMMAHAKLDSDDDAILRRPQQASQVGPSSATVSPVVIQQALKGLIAASEKRTKARAWNEHVRTGKAMAVLEKNFAKQNADTVRAVAALGKEIANQGLDINGLTVKVDSLLDKGGIIDTLTKNANIGVQAAADVKKIDEKLTTYKTESEHAYQVIFWICIVAVLLSVAVAVGSLLQGKPFREMFSRKRAILVEPDPI